MAIGGGASLTRPASETEASGVGGPARAARAAPHPYVQVALLVLAAAVAWKLAGIPLLLFSAIMLAAALSAMSDGLRKLALLPSQVTGPSGVLLASPLALVIITAIRVFYLEGCLGRQQPTVETPLRLSPWSKLRRASPSWRG